MTALDPLPKISSRRISEAEGLPQLMQILDELEVIISKT